MQSFSSFAKNMDKLVAKLGKSQLKSLFICQNDCFIFHFDPSFSLLGKLIQEGKIILDESVNKYVDYFPEKNFDGEKVAITVRQLMSHTSGIRHYDKTLPEKKEDGSEDNDKESDKENRKQEESASEKTEQECQEGGNQRRSLFICLVHCGNLLTCVLSHNECHSSCFCCMVFMFYLIAKKVYLVSFWAFCVKTSFASL